MRAGPARRFVVVAILAGMSTGCGSAGTHSPGPAGSGISRGVTRFVPNLVDLGGLTGIVVANDKLWVTDGGSPWLYQVDPATGRILHRIDLDPTDNASILGIGRDKSQLWIGFEGGPGISLTDDYARTVSPTTRRVGRWISNGVDDDLAAGFAVSPQAAYIATYASLSRIPVHGGRVLTRRLHQKNIRITALAPTSATVWVAVLHILPYTKLYGLRTDLVAYDARTLTSHRLLTLRRVTVTSILPQRAGVWLATEAGPVLRVKSDGSIERVSFPSTTQSFLADRTGVWVGELQEGVLAHIASATMKVDRTIRFTEPNHKLYWDDQPRELAALPGQLWVADASGALWRIGLAQR
jgi:hypothetical protein